MDKKIFLIFFFGILVIKNLTLIIAATVINQSIVYPGDWIRITITPNRNFGFYNLIYVHNSSGDVVDTITVPCATVCKTRQIVNYNVPLNFLGTYYFATFDYQTNNYELDYFTVTEPGTPRAGTLTVREIRNKTGGSNFVVGLGNSQNADIKINVSLTGATCEIYNVKAYLCEPSIA